MSPGREGPHASAPPVVRVRERATKTVQIGGQSFEVYQLTPEERRAFRRRVNWWIFGISAVVLCMTVAGLLLWR